MTMIIDSFTVWMCNSKNQKQMWTEMWFRIFKGKVGEGFKNLPALDAKYYQWMLQEVLLRKMHRTKFWIGSQYCFQQLTNYLNPLLEEGHALEITQF